MASNTFVNGVLDNTASSLSDNKTIGESGTVDLSLTYTHLFEKPQQELSVLTSFSRNDRVNDFISTNYNTTDNSILNRFKNENDGINEELTVQIDYITPIGTNQIVETGFKQITRTVTSNFRSSLAIDGTQFEEIASNNNQLNYNQDVTSGYGSYTYAAKSGYSLKTGLRYEYTTINAFTRTEENIEIPEYGVLVPSVNASKKLKNGNTLKVSFNRRIQRPSIQFLNPNRQQNGNALNQTIGNPQLDPEYTNNYETGYSMFIKGSSISLTGFYRNSDNAIQSLKTRSPEGDTIFTNYANIGREQAYGANLFASINIGKLNLSGGGDVYYSQLDNNVPVDSLRASNEGWVPSGRLFGGYSFDKGWGLQFFGFYRGRRVQLQGVQGGFGIYSVAVKKDFANKKGSIGLGIENFFAKSITITNETKTDNIIQNGFTTQNNLSFRLNISYRIGKMSFDNQPRRRRSINNDDLKDGGDGGDSGGQQGGGFTGGGQRGGNTSAITPRPSSTTPPVALPIDSTASVKAEGKWTYTLESPQGGSGTLLIKKEGEIYSGTINSNRMQKETAITSISVIGNEINFTYDVSFGGNTTSIMVKAIINGDAMTGNMSVGQFGSFPLVAKRIE